jgi:flagellar basal body-associated protein FliL
MKKVVVLVLFAAIIALAIWLLLQLKGFGGLGKKSDEGEGQNDTSVSEVVEQKETTTAEEATEEKSEVISISISKNEYVYDNNMVSFDELIKNISEKDKDTQIEITIDDTAAKNTVDELTDKLDELGYKNYKKLDK